MFNPHWLRKSPVPRLGLIAAALVGVVGAGTGLNTQAATPASGTLTDTNPSLSYTAGPFLLPNTSALGSGLPVTIGGITCNSNNPCDTYRLTVNVPSTYQAGYNVKVTINWAQSAADFDLYVLNSSGSVIATSASSADPEVAVIPAVSGTYTVRVVPFAPLNQSINGTVALVIRPAAPPPGTGTVPTYRVYTPPAGVGTSAGEPSLGANWKTGNVMYGAGTETLRVTFNDSANPPSATWTDKSPATNAATLDPILWTDSRNGRTIVSQLAGTTSLSSYSDNDGDSWTPNQGGGLASGVDHQTVGGGPFAGGNPLGVLGLYPNAIYYCSQDIALASCARSDNGGLTYGPAIPMYNLTQCGGLHGHVKVAPDGTVYVPNKGCNGAQGVAVSTDNGLTWTVRTVPGSLPADSDPSVAIGANGTLYFGYANGDGHPRIAVSHDKGQTWQNDQDVGTAFGLQNTVFPALVAGDDNRAAFAFLGTPTGGNYQDMATFTGVWHLYVAHTYDGGLTWVTSDATPTDPVQRGSIWMGGGSNTDRNLLDFMDVTLDRQGRVLVGFADGCLGTCVSSGPNTFSALASIARQSSGRGLFAVYDLSNN